MQMDRLTPQQMQWLMRAATGAQRAYSYYRSFRAYLAANPLMAAALVMLLLAILLRLFGVV